MLLQVPIPGGPELIIILFVLLIVFGPVVAVVVLLLQRTQGGGSDAQVAELKGRIDELEAQIAAGDEVDESPPSSANQKSDISGDAASNAVSVEDQRADEDGNTERDDGNGR